MLVRDVRLGGTLRFDHTEYGPFGTMRVESKSGDGIVRLIFDVPRNIIITVIMNHRATRTSFGLSGEPRGPVAHVA